MKGEDKMGNRQRNQRRQKGQGHTNQSINLAEVIISAVNWRSGGTKADIIISAKFTYGTNGIPRDFQVIAVYCNSLAIINSASYVNGKGNFTESAKAVDIGPCALAFHCEDKGGHTRVFTWSGDIPEEKSRHLPKPEAKVVEQVGGAVYHFGASGYYSFKLIVKGDNGLADDGRLQFVTPLGSTLKDGNAILTQNSVAMADTQREFQLYLAGDPDGEHIIKVVLKSGNTIDVRLVKPKASKLEILGASDQGVITSWDNTGKARLELKIDNPDTVDLRSNSTFEFEEGTSGQNYSGSNQYSVPIMQLAKLCFKTSSRMQDVEFDIHGRNNWQKISFWK